MTVLGTHRTSSSVLGVFWDHVDGKNRRITVPFAEYFCASRFPCGQCRKMLPPVPMKISRELLGEHDDRFEKFRSSEVPGKWFRFAVSVEVFATLRTCTLKLEFADHRLGTTAKRFTTYDAIPMGETGLHRQSPSVVGIVRGTAPLARDFFLIRLWSLRCKI